MRIHRLATLALPTVGVAVMLGVTGCSGNGTPSPTPSATQSVSSASAGPTATTGSVTAASGAASTAAKPAKPAASAKLPTAIGNWKAQGPIEATSNIDTGSYGWVGKTNLTIVSITRNTGLSAAQMLKDMAAKNITVDGRAQCTIVGQDTNAGTGSTAPGGSAICLVDLAGGVLNVTGPMNLTVADYAKLANDLYNSFPT